MGAAPALAKDTASAKPAGEAEKAIAARPEALMSKAQVKSTRTPPEALPRKGERKPEVLPRRGEHTNEPPLDVLPPEGRHNLEAPPQKREHKANARPKATRTRVNSSPIHRRESRHAKTSCPLDRDQALGTQDRGRREGTISV